MSHFSELFNEKLHQKKIPVGIIGATGMVGQKLIELLAHHPWFEVVAVAASDKSAGICYENATSWRMTSPLCEKIAKLVLQKCQPQNFPCSLIFSSLASEAAHPIETAFIKEGFFVISNSSCYRMDPTVPLLIPEINSDHLHLLATQNFKGKIVTNPNCSVTAIALALKPLMKRWGIEQCSVVTLQAISGAGYPGLAAYDLIDNVIPFIEGEEQKIEQELPKILGSYDQKKIALSPINVSAQCNRVPVLEGHLACLSVKLSQTVSQKEILNSWQDFASHFSFSLPSLAKYCLLYHPEKDFPQPRLHKQLGAGMTVSIGQLRSCNIFDWKFTILSHNTIRGAAGGALLNAELLVEKGFIKRD